MKTIHIRTTKKNLFLRPFPATQGMDRWVGSASPGQLPPVFKPVWLFLLYHEWKGQPVPCRTRTNSPSHKVRQMAVGEPHVATGSP